MPKSSLTKRVRSVYSLDERDRNLIKSFSRAIGISESQAIVLAVQIANCLGEKIESGEQVGTVNESGGILLDSLTNTMLAKYSSEYFDLD